MYTVEYAKFRRFNVGIPLYDIIFRGVVDKDLLISLIKFIKGESKKHLPESMRDDTLFGCGNIFLHNGDDKIKLKDITLYSIDSSIRKYGKWNATIYKDMPICTCDCGYITIKKLPS